LETLALCEQCAARRSDGAGRARGGGRLAGLLQGREGWQHGTQDGEEYWYFGVDGAARLTIHPEMDGFLACIADQDPGAVQRPSWIIPRIESVEEWLDEHEREHAGLTPLQAEFRKALGQEPGAPGD
jgi:hypothetical protein